MNTNVNCTPQDDRSYKITRYGVGKTEANMRLYWIKNTLLRINEITFFAVTPFLVGRKGGLSVYLLTGIRDTTIRVLHMARETAQARRGFWRISHYLNGHPHFKEPLNQEPTVPESWYIVQDLSGWVGLYCISLVVYPMRPYEPFPELTIHPTTIQIE